jgi:CheY-like chemotaxis protein
VSKIECSSYLIEYDMTHHYEGLLGNRQLGVGAVDVQDPKIESGATVAQRIQKYQWLAPEQTIVTSSCGFNHLPRHDVDDASQSQAPAHGTETILVVEDDDALRAYTVEMLGELGYRVLTAPSGAAALDLLERSSDIDLLFTDVVMPGGLNGRQLAEEAVRRRPRLKVLFTTGYTRNAIVHHGRLDPGVHMIAKPFSLDGLGAKVRALLDGRRDDEAPVPAT